MKAKRFSRQGLIRDPGDFKIKGEGPWHQEVHEFGLNYRLPDVLCALGLSQIEKLNSFKQKRAILYNGYFDLLSKFDFVTLPIQRDYVNPIWHLYPIQVDATKRHFIFEQMRLKGIGVQVNYIPAHWHPVFNSREINVNAYPVAEEFYKRQISLPIHINLTETDQEFISKTLISICNSF